MNILTLLYFIMLTLCFMGMIVCLIGLIRNQKVYKYEMKLLQKISEKCDQDIENKKEWRWRYEMLEEITYSEMIWKFWKPLNSFYDEKKMLE